MQAAFSWNGVTAFVVSFIPNLSFDRWSEIFGDPVLTAAMVDRSTHKAHIINMNGMSYRAKETKKWLNN